MSLIMSVLILLVPIEERIPLKGVSKVNLELSIGISTLIIKPISGQTIELFGEYDPEYIKEVYIEPEYFDGEVLDLEVKVSSRKSLKNISRESRGRITLALPISPVYEVDMGLGVSEAKVDLGGIPIKSLEIDCGVGELIVDFSKPNPKSGGRFKLRTGIGTSTIKNLGNGNFREIGIKTGISSLKIDLKGSWEHEAETDIDGALTDVEFTVPPDLGIRLYYRGFLSGKDIPFEKVDDCYQTTNYDETTKRVEIEFNGFLSSVDFDFVD